MADHTSYDGKGRPYPTSTIWRVLGSPEHIKSHEVWGNKLKRRDIWRDGGVEISWEDDADGNLIPGSYHTKIHRNKWHSEIIFGREMGIDGPITFAD